MQFLSNRTPTHNVAKENQRLHGCQPEIDIILRPPERRLPAKATCVPVSSTRHQLPCTSAQGCEVAGSWVGTHCSPVTADQQRRWEREGKSHGPQGTPASHSPPPERTRTPKPQPPRTARAPKARPKDPLPLPLPPPPLPPPPLLPLHSPPPPTKKKRNCSGSDFATRPRSEHHQTTRTLTCARNQWLGRSLELGCWWSRKSVQYGR